MSLLTLSTTERIVPDWFLRRLKDIDPALKVYFNPMRQRWVIDRCTRDDANLHSDHTYCLSTNVMVVQDDAGYMPLCDQVLDKLKAADVWTQFGGAANLERHLQALDDANQAKLRRDRKENTEHVTRDNRVTLNQAASLVDTVTGYEFDS